MLSPRQAFISGTHVTSVGVYFNQALLAVRLAKSENEMVQAQATAWMKHLRKVGERFTEMVGRATRIALDNGMNDAFAPTSPSDYLEWANLLNDFCSSKLETDSFRHALYLYGYCIGEALTTLAVLCTCADFQRKLNIPLNDEIAEGVESLHDTFARWEKVSKAIGSNKKYRMFNREWRRLNNLHLSIIENDLQDFETTSLDEATPKLRDLSDQLTNAERDLLELLPGEGATEKTIF